MRRFLTRITIPHIMTITVFVAVFVIATRPPIDTDTWWHLTAGDYTLGQGFIHQDPFSYTRDDTVWINHSWGAQIIMHFTYSLLGDVGLALYTTALATAGIGFMWAAGRGSVYLRAFVVILAALAAAIFWSPRPQMFSFMLSAVFIWRLRAYREQESHHIWWLAPLIWIWANLHAGYTIGFILIGGAIAGAVAARLTNPDGAELSWGAVWRLGAVAVVGLAVVPINPYGFRLLLLPFETVGIGVLQQFIQEWLPPDYTNPQTFPFILLVMITVGVVIYRRRVAWVDAVHLVGTLYLALTGARNIALFSVVAAPFIMAQLPPITSGRSVRRVSVLSGAVNLALIIVMVVGGLLAMTANLLPSAIREAQAAVLPIEAAAYLRETFPQPNLFNSYNWGGYLIFTLPIDIYPVFVDGRTDLYGDAFLRDYLTVYTADEGWDVILADYSVSTVLVEPDAPLVNALIENGWTQDYADEVAVIYRR